MTTTTHRDQIPTTFRYVDEAARQDRLAAACRAQAADPVQVEALRTRYSYAIKEDAETVRRRLLAMADLRARLARAARDAAARRGV